MHVIADSKTKEEAHLGSTAHKEECPEYRKQNDKYLEQNDSCVDWDGLRGRKNAHNEIIGCMEAVIQVNNWHANVSTQDDQTEAEKGHKKDTLQFPKAGEIQQ